VVADDGVFAECFGPHEIGLAKNSAEEAAHDTEKDKDNVMHSIVVDSIIGLKKNELSRAGWIKSFEDDSCE
jgi:hypothetical protein